MKNKLTYENYEVLFFKLLENELPKAEEQEILDQIKEDTFFSFEWSKWEQTKIANQSVTYATKHEVFFSQIQDDLAVVTEEKKRGILIWWPYAVSAAAIILISLTVLFYSSSQPSSKNNIAENTRTELQEKETPSIVDSAEKVDTNQTTLRQNSIAKASESEVINKRNEQSESNEVFVAETKDKLEFDKAVNENELPVLQDTGKQAIAKNEATKEAIPAINQDSMDKERFLALSKTNSTKRKFNITVVEESIKQKRYYTLANLREEGIRFAELMDDKRVTFVRENNKLYMRLEKSNEEIYFVSLD